MPRYKLIIEYDGTDFHGWQRQAHLPTIQEEVEKAVEKLTGYYMHVQCSGRTDAGVHAYGQVAHVDLEKAYPCFSIRNALNFYLKDKRISIVQVEEVDGHFNARFSSKKRSYLYKILNRAAPPALDLYRAWHVVRPLDIAAMQAGSQYLLGTHDFTTFRATDCQASSPIKTLDEIRIEKSGEYVHLYFTSKSFLHHQVRNMVGSLKLVGTGHWKPEDIEKARDAKDRRQGGPTAPAYGLYFMNVTY